MPFFNLIEPFSTENISYQQVLPDLSTHLRGGLSMTLGSGGSAANMIPIVTCSPGRQQEQSHGNMSKA
jgi:hypothetical protein